MLAVALAARADAPGAGADAAGGTAGEVEAEARDWACRAADQGHAAASHNCGVLVQRGGTPSALAAAAGRFGAAAAKGHGEARAALDALAAAGVAEAAAELRALDAGAAAAAAAAASAT